MEQSHFVLREIGALNDPFVSNRRHELRFAVLDERADDIPLMP